MAEFDPQQCAAHRAANEKAIDALREDLRRAESKLEAQIMEIRIQVNETKEQNVQLARHEILLERLADDLNRIAKSNEKLIENLDTLKEFRWKVMGAAMVVSGIVSFGGAYILKHI